MTFTSKDCRCEMHAFLRLPFLLCRWAGVFPIEGLQDKRTGALRYKYKSPYILYHVATLILQLMVFVCIVRDFFNTQVSLATATNLLFYANSLLSMIFLVKLARKWPKLVQRAIAIETQVASIRFTKNWDRYSSMATAIIMVLAVVEHILSVLFKIKLMMNCIDYYVIDDEFTKIYFEKSVGFIFVYTQFTHWKAFLYQIAQIQATFLWSIIDVITICISMYLVSYFRDLNKMIAERNEKNTPWEVIRIHYSHLVELVTATDKELCLLILLSVFTNLCFICLQIFYLVKYMSKMKHHETNSDFEMQNGNLDMYCRRFTARVYPGLGNCPREKIVLAYNSSEHYLYYSFSTIFLFVKASVMFLMSSNVNNEALKPMLTLLYVPASEYTIEVQRLSRQVRYTTNALSGYLFYITRPMLLQAASTIVKYELVLLQANKEDQIS